LAHFPDFYSVDQNPNYIKNYPVAAKWTLQKGLGEGVTYRSLLNHIQFDDVCWMTYVGCCTKSTGGSRVLRRFSGIQAGLCVVFVGCTETCLRVLWQYGYVHSVPRHPTNVVELRTSQIVHAFIDFRTHTLKEPDWGEPARDDTWHMRDGYVLWYTTVSHPQILPPLSGDLPRPINE